MAGSLRPARSLLVVTGPGNSGESLLASLAGSLGWAVSDAAPLHGVLLDEAAIDPVDTRPDAWATPSHPDQRLVAWLEELFATGDRVVISAHGAAPLLGHYLAAANEVAARLAVVIMLRHPADAVWPSGTVRGLAGWVNVMLGTERATRTLPRAIVPREELLDDWQGVLTTIERECGSPLLSAANLDQVASAEELVAGSVAATPNWSTLQVPPWLRDLAARTYAAFGSLADGLGDLDFVDSLRNEYAETYVAAEAMAAPSPQWARMEPAPAGPSGWFERIKRRLQR